jgi:hypothetical protein
MMVGPIKPSETTAVGEQARGSTGLEGRTRRYQPPPEVRKRQRNSACSETGLVPSPRRMGPTGDFGAEGVTIYAPAYYAIEGLESKEIGGHARGAVGILKVGGIFVHREEFDDS